MKAPPLIKGKRLGELLTTICSFDRSSSGHNRDANRYKGSWAEVFAEYYGPFLRDGMTLLDVGSGRVPTIRPQNRPDDCSYRGLDISVDELELAPEGSYEQVFARDLCIRDPQLRETIDLAISLHVLEHVASLSDAVDNVHEYLKVGGHFVALLSGRNAHFAWLNRVLPSRLGILVMKVLLKRPPESVFPARYDSGTYSEIVKLLENWQQAKVVPLYRGAYYWKFLRPAQWLYLKYEDWIARTDKRDWATHYVIVGRK
jgi:SAM-dependent methyltransferase